MLKGWEKVRERTLRVSFIKQIQNERLLGARRCSRCWKRAVKGSGFVPAPRELKDRQ